MIMQRNHLSLYWLDLLKKIKVQSVLSIDKSFIVISVVSYYDVCRMMYDEHSGRTRHRSIVLLKINKSKKMPILWQLNILINSQMNEKSAVWQESIEEKIS